MKIVIVIILTTIMLKQNNVYKTIKYIQNMMIKNYQVNKIK